VDAANQAECVEIEQARSRKGRSTEKIGILRRVKICHQFTGHEKRKSRKKAAAPYSAEAEASLLKIMMVPLLTRA
jgi:ribosomal protein S21